MKKAILVLLFGGMIAHAQERLLVAPTNEVIPLRPSQKARDVVAQHQPTIRTPAGCTNEFRFGYPPELYDPNSNIGSYHKDVLGMWFIAPANGVIDTFFWSALDVGSYDSTVSIRIHRSNIYPGHGPGYSPYPPPCYSWGYYRNLNDLDQGITPFREEATDTHWVSTSPYGTETFDPLGDELWGNGGFRVTMHADSINALPLDWLGYKPHVRKGDVFFMTMRVNSLNQHYAGYEFRTELHAWGSRVSSGNDDNYPSRMWKFYEHDSGPSNCAGVPVHLVKRGWVARGGFEDDTLAIAMYNWWFTITLDSGSMPQYEPIFLQDLLKWLHFDPFDLCISTCPDVPAESLRFSISYSIDGTPFVEAPWTPIGNETFCTTVPVGPVGSLMCYRFTGSEIYGQSPYTIDYCIRQFGFVQNGYEVDTGAAFDWIELDSIGTQVDSLQWFFRHRQPPDQPWIPRMAYDDGTSGPYDMGFSFTFFGEQLRYAWIGVNGAIALSENATDTLDLFGAGFLTIPNTPQPRDEYYLPKNFIAPFANDFALPGVQYGHGTVYFHSTGSQFIVEWKNIGRMRNESDTTATFQVILNSVDSSIVFQYADVGVSNLNKTSVIGLQADTSRWFAFNQEGYPIEMRARAGRAIRFKPLGVLEVTDNPRTPKQFALYQNYPNPFNPITDVRYSLPAGQAGMSDVRYASLKVYDVLGREVATLVDEVKQPGEYTVRWDASGMPSGVYFYRLTAGSFIDMKKMLIVR